jgi:hypothetical protein
VADGAFFGRRDYLCSQTDPLSSPRGPVSSSGCPFSADPHSSAVRLDATSHPKDAPSHRFGEKGSIFDVAPAQISEELDASERALFDKRRDLFDRGQLLLDGGGQVLETGR